MADFPQWLRDRMEEWLAREGGDRRGFITRYAKDLGVGPSTLSQWRRDAARPDEYGCILLAKSTGFPVDEVRALAGRTRRLAEAPTPYRGGDDELLIEFRDALGPDYELIASLRSEDRRRLVLSWAAIIHHHLELHRRIRELEQAEST